MSGKNSQIHLILETDLLHKAKNEAGRFGITVSELIRMKLKDEPISEEIILIKKVIEVLRNEKK